MLDRKTFETWIDQYYVSMYRLAFRLIQDYEDAEEIVQEAFLKAWRHRKRFRHESSFKTWMYRIVVNTTISWQRKRMRNRRKLARIRFERRQQSSPPMRRAEEHWMRMEMEAKLKEGLQKLPETMRVILVLRDLEGLSYEEIAVTLGIPIGTVKSRLWRARTLLREALEPAIYQWHEKPKPAQNGERQVDPRWSGVSPSDQRWGG